MPRITRPGDFQCTSGELVIADPCFDRSDWRVNVVKAKIGTWNTRTQKIERREWGERVEMLRAFHQSAIAVPCLTPAGFQVVVDSGQAGIFDGAVHRNAEAVPEDFQCEGEPANYSRPWYSYCCDHTRRPKQVGIITGGIVSCSGLGDGAFQCMIATEGDTVVAIEITFLEGERVDMPEPTFGPAYEAEHDAKRVSTQLEDVRNYMTRAKSHRTLAEIEQATGHPAASISAQLRHLRKPRFGGHTVHKRRRGEPSKGLWEYRVFALDEELPDYVGGTGCDKDSGDPPTGVLLDNSVPNHGE